MNYFLAKAGEELDLIGGDGRTAFLRFQAPNGHTFDLPVSASQLSTVLENVMPETPTRSPTRPPARKQATPLAARGVVDEEPSDPDMLLEDDEEDEPPLVLRTGGGSGGFPPHVETEEPL